MYFVQHVHWSDEFGSILEREESSMSALKDDIVGLITLVAGAVDRAG